MTKKYSCDIVIIDSGVDTSVISDNLHLPDYYNITDENTFYYSTDYSDIIGHGSAVYSIISKENTNAKICVINIFGSNTTVDDKALINALSFINKNINCKLINLSLGLSISDNLCVLEKICNEISESKTVIVSAFNNDGSFSFPAAFKSVIGVDNWYQCKSVDQYEFVSASAVNIRAKGGLQKVNWKGKTVVLGGSSFACAHITSYLFNLMDGKQMTISDALALLKEHAYSIYPEGSSHKYCSSGDIPFTIKKVALFPFNKEMHQLVRFSSDLSFEITDIYDLAQTGRVRTNTNRIIKTSQIDATNEYIIKNIRDISYDNFDTLVLGHMNEINRVAGRDIKNEIAKAAFENGKNIYSFDDIDISLKSTFPYNFFHPDVIGDNTANNFGKLYQINNPVIGICGTSSAQGKFTLQMTLRKMFIEAGYSVGEIGTEPHSLLFGMDYAFPTGYSSTLNLNDWQTISVLNEMTFSLTKRDVIIAGSQANSIPLNTKNLSAIPVQMNSFLLGINPDLVILSINPFDDIEYISNTIKYIEGLVNCKVIALVMFPMKLVDDWRATFEIKEVLREEQYLEISKYVSEHINLPVYKLGETAQMRALFSRIIESLT